MRKWRLNNRKMIRRMVMVMMMMMMMMTTTGFCVHASFQVVACTSSSCFHLLSEHVKLHGFPKSRLLEE